MATFSISEALGSGFGLIARKPLSVLAWGLAYLVLIILPVCGIFAWLGPGLFEAFHDRIRLAAGGVVGSGAFAGMMHSQMQMMAFQSAVALATVLGRAVLTGAVFRAVLEPKNSSFGYLRIGASELWLIVLMFGVGVLAAIYIVAVFLGAALTGLAVAAAFASSPTIKPFTAWAETVVALVALWLTIWVTLRLSLAGPMTFAAREFRLFESWALTRGHALRLFVLAVLEVLIIIVVYAALFCVGALVLMAVGFNFDWAGHHERMRALFEKSPTTLMAQVAPWLILVALIASVIYAGLMAIMIAPWAKAYGELSGGYIKVSVMPSQPEAPAQAGPAAPAPLSYSEQAPPAETDVRHGDGAAPPPSEEPHAGEQPGEDENGPGGH
jgi:hypothetical protein